MQWYLNINGILVMPKTLTSITAMSCYLSSKATASLCIIRGVVLATCGPFLDELEEIGTKIH